MGMVAEEEPRCSRCGLKNNLQEHHISYDPEIKIWLCVGCHKLEHPAHGVGRGIGEKIQIIWSGKTSAGFKECLETILKEGKFEKVTIEDSPLLHYQLLKHIKLLESAKTGLTHEWVTLKARGRLVVPQRLRILIGAQQGTRFDAHLYPNQHKPRGILLIKEEW